LGQSKVIVIDPKSLARDAGGKPGATFPHPALDHDDLGLVQSKVMDVIFSKSLARDAGGKPGATFPHPALEQTNSTGSGSRSAANSALAEETLQKIERQLRPGQGPGRL
jgi:hypothetical protein